MFRQSLLLLALAPVMLLAAQHTLTLTDYTGRGFAPDLIHYRIPTNFGAPDKLRVTRADGRSLAVQVTPPGKDGMRELYFVAEIPPNGASEYVLNTDGNAPVGASALQIGTEGKTAVLENGLCAIRVPVGTQSWKTPVPASSLPAPLLAFRSGANHPWLGEGKITSTRPVKAWRAELVARGPVFAEVHYEIDWAEGGYYHANIRLTDQVPMAYITEEYDLGKMAEGDGWQLELTKGWAPDTAEVAKTWGNGGVDAGRTQPLSEVKLAPIQPSGAYGDMMSQLGLFTAAEAKATPADYTMAGVVPLHQGQWRRVATLPVISPDGNHTLILQLPMDRKPPFWVETSPFCVVTHEQALPYTYARRVWGLLLNKPPLAVKSNYGSSPTGPFYQARLLYGQVGLDRYKDYITQWPDTHPAYPRSLIHQVDLPKYPDPSVLQYKPDQSLGYLKNLTRYLISTPTPSHHQTFEGLSMVAGMEKQLALPDLPPAQRQELRARLAVATYLMMEPDNMGNGNGAHVGNPNMSMARQSWSASLVALLPDHPMYQDWKNFISAYIEHKYADNMAPGGGWFEFGGYHMWGFQRQMEGMYGLEAMQPANIDRLYMYEKTDLDYFMNLLTPYDSRYGARQIPGFGNSGNRYTDAFLTGAGNFADRDPDFAANLLWAWQENGRQPVSPAAEMRPWLQPKEPALSSRLFPGFGVIFRAHQGPEETYLALRSGFLWSHWYVDQAHMVLYSKGAALLPGQPYAYYTSPNADFSQYNDIRFGSPENEFHYSWSDSNVLSHFFGQRVQYAWASLGYPAWFINPGMAKPFGGPRKLAEGIAQQEGDFTWDRRIAFFVGNTAKSPNYFVIRDTAAGDGKLAQWLNLNVVGTKADIQVQPDALKINTEWPTKLDVLFPGQVIKPEMADDPTFVDLHPMIFGKTWAEAMKNGRVSPNWARKDGKALDPATRVTPDLEKHVLIRIPDKPGADHFWLLYPQGAGEATPVVSRPASNVIKVTHAEGTDYLLLAARPDSFTGDGVTLSGTAAAVRLSLRDVTLAVLEGRGSAGFDKTLLNGIGPYEKTFTRNALPAGPQVMPAAPNIPFVSKAPAANGITKILGKDMTTYEVESDHPVSATLDNVHIEGRRAQVTITPTGIRFLAPEATYVKLTVGVVGIRGFGPFDLTFTPAGITGTVNGDMRTLVITRPEKIIRPMFHLDGVRWYASYADDTASYRGRTDPQFSMAFAVTEGRHTIAIAEWESPILPPPPALTALPGK